MGLKVVNDVIAKANKAPEVQAARQELDDARAEFFEAEAVYRRDWQKTFGAPFPTTLEEWQQWAIRADVSGRYLPAENMASGKWTGADILPYIEGYLQRLHDQQASVLGGAGTSSDTNERTATPAEPATATDVNGYHQSVSGETIREFRLACEIESFCKMLDAGKDKIPIVQSYLMLVTNGPYKHQPLVSATAHQLAWDFAHRLWLAVFNVICTTEQEVQDILAGGNPFEGSPRFQLDRALLDTNWEAIRGELRKVKPIDAHHFTKLVQIESARAARAWQDQDDKARMAAATGGTEAGVNARRPLFVVNHWSELAIGVDGHWRYWAKTPVPMVGDKFIKQDAYALKLPGKRWKAFLRLLGESASGNCCDTATLIRELGYLPPTSSLPRDGRTRPGSLERDLTSDLPRQIIPPLDHLKDDVKDLARKLRKQIGGTKGRDQKAALRIDGEWVRSGFVVGFLVPDDEGHLIFRHQLS